MLADLSGAALLAATAGYAAGSIPFGIVLTRLAGLGDLRAIGSGNIGATNALRTGSRALAAAVLLLDAGKGAAAVLVAANWGWPAAAAAGFGAFAGHLFPIWLRLSGMRGLVSALPVLLVAAAGLSLALAGWQTGAALPAVGGAALFAVAARFAWGGKGVATALGVLAAALWPAGLAAALTWLAAALLSRRSSVGALAALASAPGWAFWFGGAAPAWLAGALAVAVLVRHQDNIARLLRGDEPPIRLGADRS